METLIKWIKDIMHILAVGIFYFFDLIMLVIICSNEDVLNNFSNIDYSNNILIIIITILFISYIIGIVMQKAAQRIIWIWPPQLFIWLCWGEKKKKMKGDKNRDNPCEARFRKIVEDGKLENKDGYYRTLTVLRHLIISIPTLEILILIYLFTRDDYFKFGSFLLLPFILFGCCLFVAHKQQQRQQQIINECNN